MSTEQALKSATYIGPFESWKGHRCLVRPNPDNDWSWLVQFDTLNERYQGVLLTHHWHAFNKAYFKVDDDAA